MSVTGAPPVSAREARLVARAQRGETAAFEELIVLHAALLHRMLTRVLGNAGDADEVIREALVEAWSALLRYRDDGRFSTWLYRIAINEASRRLPDDGARAVLLTPEDANHDPPDLESGTQGKPTERNAYLELCVAELPPDYRAVVVLRDIEGLSNEEAAVVLGLELACFKRRLHQARMAIRARLEQFELGADSGRPAR